MRMWEIREGYEKDGYRRGRGRMGMRHEKTVEEAYECGFEEGYAMAMKESKHAYKEHDYHERGSYGYGERRGRY